ncbi:acetylornithine deacetylase [Marivivens donghaensis]|uniref:acetylornithine deacetylase n=1 Tax=Marivivens donghaensis TaxID=1699413 RepID=UPI00201FA690|nr:acetylornithine deacetylase [Marivivens donghaensis]MCL7410034.1 acetylornithine deacetylase [Marivivens donghaensis]MDN3705365.1 acetylornithine deacetylase [Marivivens donghaensis]
MSRTIEILRELVAFDTVSAKSNLAIIDWIEAHLTALGFRVTRITDPYEPKAGLYAEIGPEGDGVVLSAHTDVVPVEGQNWTRPPFELTEEDGRLYGRGTTDMKGFLASVLAFAEVAAGADLTAPIKLVISYDEEIGCVGMGRMIEALRPLIGTPRVCIVGEPTSLDVAIGHKGKKSYRAICRGEAGHSALAPKFVNAIYVATDLISGLRTLQAKFAGSGVVDDDYTVPYSTVHVGKLTGGTALNIVPDVAELLFEIRYLAADRIEDFEADLAALVAQVEQDRKGAVIEIDGLISYPGLDVKPDADCVKFMQRISGKNGVTKVAYGTEAGFFDAIGIPTVVCGPGSMEGQGHKADEYILTSELEACDAMLLRLLEDLV